MGALASGGVRVLNDEVIALARITPATIDAATRMTGLDDLRVEQLHGLPLERTLRCLRQRRPCGVAKCTYAIGDSALGLRRR